MKTFDVLFYFFCLFIILITIKGIYNSDFMQLKCIVSSVDGNTYCVRERKRIEMAADLLAKTTEKCKQLVLYVGKKYPDNEDVQRLLKNFNPKKINETLPTSNLTAYSENKGEKIAFCLNKEKNGSQMIDLTTLTFVAIHELSHIMTKTIGHNQDFWNNFKFLLENAKESGIHNPIDYKTSPQKYCGMMITDNPYFDI
uniref:WLM domain-containing protein n=1 Tax=viral metagenome TaxID=1070528 RepID=A0A6C0H678_9ZZZZ